MKNLKEKINYYIDYFKFCLAKNIEVKDLNNNQSKIINLKTKFGLDKEKLLQVSINNAIEKFKDILCSLNILISISNSCL